MLKRITDKSHGIRNFASVFFSSLGLVFLLFGGLGFVGSAKAGISCTVKPCTSETYGFFNSCCSSGTCPVNPPPHVFHCVAVAGPAGKICACSASI
jgi:hypothetical protein